MQIAHIEWKTSGFIANVAGMLADQWRAAMNRMALQARIKQERRQLLDMPDDLLKDIGITRAQAVREAMSSAMPDRSC